MIEGRGIAVGLVGPRPARPYPSYATDSLYFIFRPQLFFWLPIVLSTSTHYILIAVIVEENVSKLWVSA